MRRTTGSIPTRSSMRCARASSGRCTWRAASPSVTSLFPSRCLRIPTAIRSLMRPSISWNTRLRGRRLPSSSWSATTGSTPAKRSSTTSPVFARAWPYRDQGRPMAKPLLERQVNLIEHMTSGAVIFGAEGDSAADLEGIDRALLRVEAQFSYAKRMEKITAVLPRTFELLGSSRDAYVRAFVESWPPTTLSRLENACQFHRYLVSCWRREAPDPPCICDVAAFEIACAKVDADPEHHSSDRTTSADRVHRGSIRRCPNVILLRCAYDIRPIFETGSEKAVPMKRETPLVVALPPGADGPQVFEVVPAIFDLLAALDDWTDPQGLDVEPGFAKLLA